MVAKHIPYGHPSVVLQRPRSYQLRGPFALPRLCHDISILLGKHGLKSMGDCCLATPEAAAFDGLVNRSPKRPRHPNVHFAISPFPTRLTKPLKARDLLCIRHGLHPLLSSRIEKCPILRREWSRLARIRSR